MMTLFIAEPDWNAQKLVDALWAFYFANAQRKVLEKTWGMLVGDSVHFRQIILEACEQVEREGAGWLDVEWRLDRGRLSYFCRLWLCGNWWTLLPHRNA